MTTPGAGRPGELGDDEGEPGEPAQSVREMLFARGLSAEEVAAAEHEGTLPLLAVERLVVPETTLYDVATVAERTGLAAEVVLQIWRTLGYPEPRPDEVAFSDTDVEILTEVGRLMAGDLAPPGLVLQMSRVIGSSMARIASAQVDVIGALAPGSPRSSLVGRELTDERIVVAAQELLPIVPSVLTATWRRHLRAAIRRRLSIAETGEGQLGVVGFADLVGFTALSQQVADDELAAIVDQFEDLAYDVVTAHGGRVVKMIGDEVMFTVDAPEAAAEVALALSEGTRGAEELSDLRVGMAFGPLLEREGDLFGPVVNLASRIAAIALPGSVVIDEGLHDRLVGGEGYRLRSLRPRYLKDIGRVRLWALRRVAPADTRFSARRRALREAVRARVEPPGVS